LQQDGVSAAKQVQEGPCHGRSSGTLPNGRLRRSEVAAYRPNSEICHAARFGREAKQREQIGKLPPGFIHQPKLDVVVLVRLPVIGIEIGAEGMGVDVFLVIAEGEVVENV
jgi:hypothetical protein